MIVGLIFGTLLGIGLGWVRWGWRPWDTPLPKDKVTAGTLADKYRTPGKTTGRGGH